MYNNIMAKKMTIGEKTIKANLHKRTITQASRNQNARQAIGPINSGMNVYGINFGQFSFINILEDILGQIKEPVELDISSWTIAKFEALRLEKLNNERLRRIRIMLDSSISSLAPDTLKYLVASMGDNAIRILRCHCKFAIITSATWNIAIRTSMNLNQNKRLENFEISDCKVLTTYMSSIVDDIFLSSFDLKDKIKLESIGSKESTLDDLLINSRQIEGLLAK